MKIIFATKNQGKVREIKQILADMPCEVLSLKDAGIDIDVVEDGATFAENAVKKAVEIMKASGEICLADDSGLEIDYLDKAPGVYSARFMGEDTPYEIKNNKIIEMLKGVPDEKRTARFISVIAAAFPDGRVMTTEGVIEGRVAYETKGENGFGYDPLFFLPEYGKTTAELPLEIKNEISHRGKALKLMKEKLKEVFGDKL